MSSETKNLEIVYRTKEDLRGLRNFIRENTKAEKTTIKTQKSISGMDASVNKTNTSLLKVAGAAGGVALLTIALTKLFAEVKNGIKDYTEFQRTMSDANTLMDVDKKTVVEYQKEIMKLSEVYGIRNTVMTEGLYNVVSASVEASNRLSVLEQATQAGVAGRASTELAVQAGVSTVRAYGLSLDELTRVYDLQFSTVKRGFLRYEELGSAMSNVLTPASRLKVELETMYGAIAFLTQRGQSAAEATTALGRAFDGIVKKGDKLKSVLNIDIFDSTGSMKDFSIIIGELAGKLDGVSDKKRENVLNEMGFDIRAARAIIPIISNIEAFRKETELMYEATGSMEKAYKNATDNIDTDWKMFTQSLRNDWQEMVMEMETPIRVSIQMATSFAGNTNELMKMAFGNLNKDDIEAAGGMYFSDPLDWALSLFKGHSGLNQKIADDFSYSQGLRGTKHRDTVYKGYNADAEYDQNGQNIYNDWLIEKNSKNNSNNDIDIIKKELSEFETVVMNTANSLKAVDLIGSAIGIDKIDRVKQKISVLESGIGKLAEDGQITDEESTLFATYSEQLKDLNTQLDIIEKGNKLQKIKEEFEEFKGELDTDYSKVDTLGDIFGVDQLERFESQLSIVKSGIEDIYSDGIVSKHEEKFLDSLIAEYKALNIEIGELENFKINKGPNFISENSQQNDLDLINKHADEREKQEKEFMEGLESMADSLYKAADLIESSFIKDMASVFNAGVGITQGVGSLESLNFSSFSDLGNMDFTSISKSLGSFMSIAGAGASIGSALGGSDLGSGIGGGVGTGIGAAVGSIIPGVGTAIGAGIGSALGGAVGGMFGSGDSNEAERQAEREATMQEYSKVFADAVEEFVDGIKTTGGLGEAFDTIGKINDDVLDNDYISNIINGSKEHWTGAKDTMDIDDLYALLPTYTNEEVKSLWKATFGNLEMKDHDSISTGYGTRHGSLPTGTLTAAILTANETVLDELQGHIEQVIGFTQEGIQGAVVGGFENGSDSVRSTLEEDITSALYSTFTNTKLFLTASDSFSKVFQESIREKLSEDENLGIDLDIDSLESIEDYMEFFERYTDVAGTEIDKWLESLGIAKNRVTELGEAMKSALSSAMNSALLENDFDTFSESLGESIYNNVRSSLIDAFMETAVYQGYIDKYLKFDDVLNGDESFEEAFNKMNDYLGTIENQLRQDGLDFSSTDGTSNSSSNWRNSNYVGEEATTSIVHNNNYYQAQIENYTGTLENLYDDLEEIKRDREASSV